MPGTPPCPWTQNTRPPARQGGHWGCNPHPRGSQVGTLMESGVWPVEGRAASRWPEGFLEEGAFELGLESSYWCCDCTGLTELRTGIKPAPRAPPHTAASHARAAHPHSPSHRAWEKTSLPGSVWRDRRGRTPPGRPHGGWPRARTGWSASTLLSPWSRGPPARDRGGHRGSGPGTPLLATPGHVRRLCRSRLWALQAGLPRPAFRISFRCHQAHAHTPA